MDCGWGSSEDEEGLMEIDLDAKQEDSRENAAGTAAAGTGEPRKALADCYDPANPTDDYDPTEPTGVIDAEKDQESAVQDVSDYDPADPTLSDEEVEDSHLAETSESPAPNSLNENRNGEESDFNGKGDEGEASEENDGEKGVVDYPDREEDNNGGWNSPVSSPRLENLSSPEYYDSPENDKPDSEKDEARDNGPLGSSDGKEANTSDNRASSASPVQRDENSQMSAISEVDNDNLDDGNSDVPDVTFDDSDFVLEKEPFHPEDREDESEAINGPGSDQNSFGWPDDTALKEQEESKSSSKVQNEEDEAEERERRRQEEVACLNEEALVDLFREESEPDKEIADGEMIEQQVKKVKKKVVSKKVKKKGKKLKKGLGKKGQQGSKLYDPEHGDQRFVEISRDRPSVESREEGELEGEGEASLSRRRSSYEGRSHGQHHHEYSGEERGRHGEERSRHGEERSRHAEERSRHEEQDLREPGEIVESEAKKKGLKKKDKKEKRKKKARREVATIEEGNPGDEDSQKFPSFLAGFFVQDGMDELEEGQEAFVNDFDQEDPRSLFAKASGDKSHRKRSAEGSDHGSVGSFEERVRRDSEDGVEGHDTWRNRRHEERWQESREVRQNSRERRHESREGREVRYDKEREHTLDISAEREKERDRSRSERGRERGRDKEREREREREKESQRDRERSRRSGEDRRRRSSRSRSRERRRRSGSHDRNRRSRSRGRSSRHRRRRSRSQEKSAERERERDRERERERARRHRREQRSRERESERRVRRVSHSKSRSPTRRRSERASSNKENREEPHRRRRRQRGQSEESESEERENNRRSYRQPRRDRERSSSESAGSSSDSSSSPSFSNRPDNNATHLSHLRFGNYSEDEGNSSDVILVEPERIVINLDEEEDPPSRVDITHGNAGDDENAMLDDGQSIPPPSAMSTRPRGSALVRINPDVDHDTRVVESVHRGEDEEDDEDVGDATPTRDEASDKARTVIVSSPRASASEEQASEPVKESDYDPAHPTEEDAEDVSERQQEEQKSQESPEVSQSGVVSGSLTPPSGERGGPVPPDHPPPEEIRPSPPPIPAETEAMPLPHQQQQHQHQPQPLGPALPSNLMNNPVMQLINPLLMQQQKHQQQQQQQQMGMGPQPGGGLLPLPNQPPQRFPWQRNPGRDTDGGGPPGFPQGQQRHIRPLLQLPDRPGPGFGGQDPPSLLRPFGPLGQQQQQNNNMHPGPRMPISSMPQLAQLTSLLPALEKVKMAVPQQQELHPPSHLGPMFNNKQSQQHHASLLGKPPLSTSSASNMGSNSSHNNLPFRSNRPDFSESTEVVDMDMSPGDDDCELELPSPNSDSSGALEGRVRRRRRGGNSQTTRNNAQDNGKTLVGKGVIQPVAYLKALSKALEKLDPKGQSQAGSGHSAHDKGKSGASKKHRKVDLDDDVPASAVDLTNKEKYLKKLHFQERVIDEVKLAIKPFYNSKKISKEQYKLILRKAVPKVCHCKSGNINPQKIQQLVEAYVMKMIQKHGGPHGGSGKKKSKGPKDGGPATGEGGIKQNGERAKKSVAGR